MVDNALNILRDLDDIRLFKGEDILLELEGQLAKKFLKRTMMLFDEELSSDSAHLVPVFSVIAESVPVCGALMEEHVRRHSDKFTPDQLEVLNSFDFCKFFIFRILHHIYFSSAILNKMDLIHVDKNESVSVLKLMDSAINDLFSSLGDFLDEENKKIFTYFVREVLLFLAFAKFSSVEFFNAFQSVLKEFKESPIYISKDSFANEVSKENKNFSDSKYEKFRKNISLN